METAAYPTVPLNGPRPGRAERMAAHLDRHQVGQFQRGGEFDVSGGPVKARGCTDCWCILVFLAAWAVMGVIIWNAAHNADPKLLTHLSHGYGLGPNNHLSQCGVDSAVIHFPYTYLSCPSGNCTDASDLQPYCTTKCPQSSDVADACSGQAPGTLVQRDSSLCPSGAYCMWYCGGDTVKLGSFCFDPTLASSMIPGNASVIADINASWPWILGLVAVSVVIGFLYLLFVRFCSGLFVLLSVLIVVGGLAVAGWAGWTNAAKLKEEANIDESWTHVLCICIWVLDGIVVLILLCRLKSLRIATAMLKTASLFLIDVKAALLQPLVTAACEFGAVLAFAFMAILVMSAGLESNQPETPTGSDVQFSMGNSTVFCQKEQDGKMVADPFCLQWHNQGVVAVSLLVVLFMYLWCAFLISAYSKFTTAHAVCAWYFSPMDADGTKYLGGHGNSCCDCRFFFSSLITALAHHTGSLIFGSMVCAIAALVRIIVGWMKHYLDHDPNSNCLVKCLACVVTCIVTCIERFIIFISSQAYIQMALTGFGFCRSAASSFAIAVRHPVRMAVVTQVSFVVELLGALVIAAATGAIAWGVFTGVPSVADNVSQPLTPTICVGLLSLLMGEIMMHPFTLTAQACMHSFVADEEMHGAGATHTPPPLRKFVDDNCR